jgi:hypothetical protein
MATLNFIRIAETTDKAIKVIVREAGYDLQKFRAVHEKYFWLPKSVCSNLSDTSVEVADWFFDKNIAVDTYAVFMKALANS